MATPKYLCIPDDDSEYGPVWEYSEAQEEFTEEELQDAEPAEQVLSLDDYRGHYLQADFLYYAADILESCQLDCDTYHLDDPKNFQLRDAVDALKDEANTAWGRYHAHNGLYPDPDQVQDYGDDCPRDDHGYPECECQWISDLVDDMESVLGDLGFVTQWGDGVSTFRILD